MNQVGNNESGRAGRQSYNSLVSLLWRHHGYVYTVLVSPDVAMSTVAFILLQHNYSCIYCLIPNLRSRFLISQMLFKYLVAFKFIICSCL